MQNKDAKLIAENSFGQQLRYARTKADTWPGWSAPLGTAGYWRGTHADHEFIGRTKTSVADQLEFYGFEDVVTEWGISLHGENYQGRA